MLIQVLNSTSNILLQVLSIVDIANINHRRYTYKMTNPEHNNNFETPKEYTISQYLNFKTKLLTSTKFLSLTYTQQKSTIYQSATKYPITGTTKQQIIEDLTL